MGRVIKNWVAQYCHYCLVRHRRNISMVSLLGLFSLLMARVVAGQTDSWSTLYTATINISSSSWVSRVVTSRSASSLLTCAGHCQDRQLSWGDCNSFTYQATTGQCEMGDITYLEDPAPGETAVRLMVVEDLVDSLKMYCRGGDGCCGAGSNRLCAEGEGDCDDDSQCAGVLECGSDNCAIKTGGYWDDSDDCCQARCSSDRQCVQGWGPCTDNSHCEGSENGYNVCDKTCLGTISNLSSCSTLSSNIIIIMIF